MRETLPSIEEIQPLADRVREYAQEELPEPQTMKIEVFDDQTFQIRAYHSGPGEQEYLIHYLREDEAIEYLHITGHDVTVTDTEHGQRHDPDPEIAGQRVLEEYPNPLL
jgi:hypothetical protein